jgi:hypothetical protein
MIAYDLQCHNGHCFEGWFEDARAFRSQRKKGLIACPVCGDTQTDRLPSTFAIKSSTAPSPSRQTQTGAAVDMALLGKKIVEFVESNFDNVGSDFTKEALKMHYGVKPPRNIRGISSDEEEKTLKQEGIDFFKIPLPAPPDTDG